MDLDHAGWFFALCNRWNGGKITTIYIYIWRKNGLEESSAIDREVCEVEALVLVVELPVSMLEATDKHNQSSDIMVKFSK